MASEILKLPFDNCIIESSLSLIYHVLPQYPSYLVYLLDIMPLPRNLMLPLRTLTLRCIAKNVTLFWKKEWDPGLLRATKASDDILLNIRKNYYK